MSGLGGIDQMAGCRERWAAQGGAGPTPANWLIQEAPALGWLLTGLRQHRWMTAGVWLAITSGAAGWIWRLPSIYEAEAIVLIESYRVPPQLAPDTGDTSLEARLEAARQKLLASAELQATSSKLRLSAESNQRDAREESLVAKMRQNLTIAPIAPSSRGHPGPIRVAFRWENTQTAAQVANHLAWRFVQEVSQTRRFGPGVAAQFLSTQVASAKRELEQREAGLREFRFRYAEELPEQAQALRSAAWQLRSELATLSEENLRLAREKNALEQAERGARTQEAALEYPRPEKSGTGLANGGSGGKPLHSEELKKRLAALLALYKPEHPDVRRLMAEVARAETLEAETEARSRAESSGEAPERGPSGGTERTSGTQARLEAIETRLENLATRRARLAVELGLIEQRLQRVPLRELELAALMREHAHFSEWYRTVAARRQSAEMAEALERSYPSERVTLLDEARPPEMPLGPRRWLMLGVASLAGLAVSCLLAIAKGYPLAAFQQEETLPPRETSHHDPCAEEWPLASSATATSVCQMVQGG